MSDLWWIFTGAAIAGSLAVLVQSCQVDAAVAPRCFGAFDRAYCPEEETRFQ